MSACSVHHLHEFRGWGKGFREASEHRVVVRRLLRHYLQHVPVFHYPAAIVDAKDVDPGTVFLFLRTRCWIFSGLIGAFVFGSRPPIELGAYIVNFQDIEAKKKRVYLTNIGARNSLESLPSLSTASGSVASLVW